ncbi:TLC domain-containing protein [Lipomyces tetrasporus]|uniref:TLC domain-containing protein n=1 Tax=Lipomyces tetrasporus TaxID=54092 RepID=A0AAD7QQV3_9ASCO|nr:TLC domain-containing protein [Lipomyces tetrasporus]KAJ8099764.1 TLC domain-containing protein [Lipomyces tetrasporus]
MAAVTTQSASTLKKSAIASRKSTGISSLTHRKSSATLALGSTRVSSMESFPKTPSPASPNALVLYFVKNQITLPIYLVGALILVHVVLPFQHITSKFLYLSHRVEHSGLYVKGPDDVYFVFFWVVAFTFIRAFTMDYVFVPFARFSGISSRKGLTRFAEQAWCCGYYGLSGSLGTYLMYNSPYWLNTDELWLGWPHRELKHMFKWYYLVQLAFWLQQIYVLNIEERRKDHRQMFTHHIVTCALLIASYNYCFTRVGNAVLCLMDIVDSVFSAAKMLKYLGHQRLCDIMFGVFILTWIIGRHVLYMKLVLSAMYDSPKLIGYKCFFEPLDDVISVGDAISNGISNKTRMWLGEEQCFTEIVHFSFIFLLWVLQGIMLMWFYMIIKVAVRVLSGGGADDSRSDGEQDDDDDSTEVFEDEKAEPKKMDDAEAEIDDEATLVDAAADAVELSS